MDESSHQTPGSSWSKSKVDPFWGVYDFILATLKTISLSSTFLYLVDFTLLCEHQTLTVLTETTQTDCCWLIEVVSGGLMPTCWLLHECPIFRPLSSWFTLWHQLCLLTEVSAVPVSVINRIYCDILWIYGLFAQELQLICDSSSSQRSSAGRALSFWAEDPPLLKGYFHIYMVYCSHHI